MRPIEKNYAAEDERSMKQGDEDAVQALGLLSPRPEFFQSANDRHERKNKFRRYAFRVPTLDLDTL
jgi:hypothetical protein